MFNDKICGAVHATVDNILSRDSLMREEFASQRRRIIKLVRECAVLSLLIYFKFRKYTIKVTGNSRIYLNKIYLREKRAINIHYILC